MCHITIILLTVFAFCAKSLNADSDCGDWHTYKDEKCVLILESNVQSYDDAINSCLQFGSTLVTITSLEEQRFIENYVLTQGIYDFVWIGLRYNNVTNKYKWSNGLDTDYTNWSEGSPTNTSDRCVQISSDLLRLAKWSDTSCAKKNLAMCQKMPNITLQQLQSMFIDTRNKLQTTVDQLIVANNSVKILRKQFDFVFSQNWLNIKTFTENNTRKALVYPYKTVARLLRSDAISLCKANNATIVDIESPEKQSLVESFLYDINTRSDSYYLDFWIGCYSDSGKFKSYNSGNELVYTNWLTGHPGANPYAYIHGQSQNGKWYGTTLADTRNVFCEITFTI